MVSLAVGSGLALALAFPPYGQIWLAVPAVAVFLYSARQAGWTAGLGFGLGFFGLLFPWLGELGLIAVLPLVIVQSLFSAAYGALVKWGARRTDLVWLGSVAMGWGVMELARERIPLGGFPWGMLGYTVGPIDPLRHAAQWIGASGWSVVLAGLAAALVLLLLDRRREPVAALAAVIGLLAAGGAVFDPAPTGPEVSVAIVQGSEPCLGYHCPGERREIYQSHLDLTRSLRPGATRLVVWAEGSTGFDADPILDPAVGTAIGEEARRLGAWMIVGGDRPVSDREWINANVVFAPDGEIVGEYRKRHPVPFGEYIPARPLFDWIPALAAVPRDMIRGERASVFDMDFGRVGSVISFEGSFSRYLRDTANQGAEVLVTATSQSSYPLSPASDQFLAITRLRSAELSRDIVQAAVTGRSGFVTEGGELAATTGLGTAEVLEGTVRLSDRRTLYALVGDWVQWLSLIGLGWLFVAARDERGRFSRVEA